MTTTFLGCIPRFTSALFLSVLLLAGCSSSSTQPSDDGPAATPTPPSTQPTPVEVEPEDPWKVDTDGNPLNNFGEPVGRLFYFDFDRYVVKPRAQRLLAQHAEYLRTHADRSVRLEGHADERGTRDYNLALGERRADAVRQYLVARGVRAGQVRSVSYGEERPVDPGHDEAAWARNRRVEMIYN